MLDNQARIRSLERTISRPGKTCSVLLQLGATNFWLRQLVEIRNEWRHSTPVKQRMLANDRFPLVVALAVVFVIVGAPVVGSALTRLESRQQHCELNKEKKNNHQTG